MKLLRLLSLAAAALCLAPAVHAQEPYIIGVRGSNAVEIWNGGVPKFRFANNQIIGLNGASTGPVYRTAVRLATTANGTMATAFDNGSTVDGVVIATGDRLLLKNQTTASENGIYVAVASGAPTRPSDADSWAEIIGVNVSVTAGTANGGTIFRNTNDPTVNGVIGTTSMTWSQDSGAAALALKANIAGPTFTGTVTTDVLTVAGLGTFSAGITGTGEENWDFGAASGTFDGPTGTTTFNGPVIAAEDTTPTITTASGKTNTGYVAVNGKTSGQFRITAADAAAQTVTMSLAAQTTGAATLTVGDMGGVNGSVAIARSEVVAATNVILAAESGAVFFLNHATEFVSTLPAPALGLRYTFIVTGAPSGANYTIVSNGSGAGNDIIKFMGVAADGNAGDTGTADDTISFVSGQALAGDRVDVFSDGTSWLAYGFSRVPAGITATDAD